MPVFNEAGELPETVDALLAAVAQADFDADLVVVDDGSTDGSGDAARRSVGDVMPLRVIEQSNRGRFEARRAGLGAADGDYVLLLDARVRLRPDALRFVAEQVRAGRSVWNAHVVIETDSPFGIFLRLLAELAWRDYFDNPRRTSFGVEDFDRFPKGTTCFFAPRELLLGAVAAFRTRYGDVRLANDDTPVLRALASRERIWISPEFACTYAPRETAARFVRHAFHRGVVFVDGHMTPESRFFLPALAFFPASAAVVAAAFRRPLVAPLALGAVGVAAAAYGTHAERSADEVEALALVAPLYAVAHGAGMWRGLAELVRARFAS